MPAARPLVTALMSGDGEDQVSTEELARLAYMLSRGATDSAEAGGAATAWTAAHPHMETFHGITYREYCATTQEVMDSLHDVIQVMHYRGTPPF